MTTETCRTPQIPVRDAGPTYRALLVDDERIATLYLRTLLAAHPEIEVVGEAKNFLEAEALCERLSPDVVFLDVKMPGTQGVPSLSKLKNYAHIIFVSGYDKYALEAFGAEALDYILKPVSPVRLEESIRRLRKLPASDKSSNGKLEMGGSVMAGDAEQITTLRLEEISGIQAEGNYSRIFTRDGRPAPLMLRNLARWEELIPSPPFVRIDRSLIVNLSCVRELKAVSRNHAKLLLEGALVALNIGRTAAIRLRSALRNPTLREAC